MRDGDELRVDLPPHVERVIATLRETGAEVALVGGCVRDVVLGQKPGDWDIATSAPPERVEAAFERSVWENPFGTVTVLSADGAAVEVTTYRREGAYRDRRRPESVSWGGSLEEDLSRRDFTINAMAWLPSGPAGAGRLVDPFEGTGDLATRVLRAVGDADARIAEDALRMVRAVRFATRFGLEIEPATEIAIRRHAAAASQLSGERVREELLRILRAEATPSGALLLMERLGLLRVLLPELADLRGVPQAKALPGDALDHSLRTMDALPPSDPIMRVAGLLHDLGKAGTLADGHFIGHERVGAELTERVMERLRFPRADIARVQRLVAEHMFDYRPDWTDAAVRRFIRRVGPGLLDDLFALRAADNAASGAREPPRGGLAELRSRVATALVGDPMQPAQLAVDGHDLVSELGIAPGPVVGELLAYLLEAVLDDPRQNRREALLARARHRLGELHSGDHGQREPGPAVGD